MKIWKAIDTLLDRLSAVVGAFLFAQAPEFFQQYLQRLGGHVDELKKQMVQLSYFSSKSGKSLQEYIHKFIHHSDSDVVEQGKFMQALWSRYDHLRKGWEALSDASLFTRPFKYLWYGDTEIISATYATYKPAVAFTYEGLFYAFLGAFIGYGCYNGLKLFLTFIYRKGKFDRNHPKEKRDVKEH